MEIISALETSPRGVYCGAIGLLAPPGSGRPRAEFSVAIRTLVIDERDRSAEYGVGGGVVHESTAAEEYKEAMVKARVLQRRRAPVTLLETMRWDPGTGIWLLDRHLIRLRSSARYLGITLPKVEVIGLLEGVGGDYPLRVRLLVPENGPAGYRGEADGLAAPDRGPCPRYTSGRPIRLSPISQDHAPDALQGGGGQASGSR